MSSPPSKSVRLEPPSMRHAEAFLGAVRRSRGLHRGLVTPPRTREAFREYLARFRRPTHAAHLVCLRDGRIAGVVNVSEIVRGVFQSAYLGFYALAPHDGKGYMTEGVGLVVARLGFRLEGLSPRYLKIGGRWRDHERWAITREDRLARSKGET